MHKLLRQPYFWLLLFLAVGALLRLYRLADYVQFLGDQGRDVLAVKHILIDHQPTLLGPTASVGGFYIGALYYYFMLPFLYLFSYDPVGPAVMAVCFGLGTIWLIFEFCRRFFNIRVALIAAFLVTLSSKMISISRFSWNPNPVPFFALLTIYFLFLSATRKKLFYTLLAGISLGVLFELHYIDIAFAPIVGAAALLIFPLAQLPLQLMVLFIGWFVGNSPFILFEWRHGFPNTRSVLEFIFRGGKTVSPRSYNLFWLFNDIGRICFETVLAFRGMFLNFVFYSSLASFSWWGVEQFYKRQKHIRLYLMFLWVVMGIYGVGLYQGHLLDHYFSYLFPIPFILVALFLSYLFKYKLTRPVFLIVLVALIYYQISTLYIWSRPNNLIAQTKQISQKVLDLSEGAPYNFALITPANSDHAYRYFLELADKAPVTIENPQKDPQRQTVTKQLIVVCEQTNCQPLGNSLWEVAGFGRADISQVVDGPAGIKIYKLLHYTGKQ